MRTNIEIDDDLLALARQALGTKTKRDTVEAALREVVSRRQRLRILDLVGKVHWEGDLGEPRRDRDEG